MQTVYSRIRRGNERSHLPLAHGPIGTTRRKSVKLPFWERMEDLDQKRVTHLPLTWKRRLQHEFFPKKFPHHSIIQPNTAWHSTSLTAGQLSACLLVVAAPSNLGQPGLGAFVFASEQGHRIELNRHLKLMDYFSYVFFARFSRLVTTYLFQFKLSQILENSVACLDRTTLG